jgi:rhodanese-related sulfurtransferase
MEMTTTTLKTTTTPQDRLTFLKQELDVFIGPHDFNEMGGATTDEVTLIDVRKAESFAKGHVPGAVNIPRRELRDNLSDIPKDTNVVVYCSDITCFASKKAMVTLLNSGYDNVRVMYGGFDGWKAKGFEVETGEGQKTVAPSTN